RWRGRWASLLDEGVASRPVGRLPSGSVTPRRRTSLPDGCLGLVPAGLGTVHTGLGPDGGVGLGAQVAAELLGEREGDGLLGGGDGLDVLVAVGGEPLQDAVDQDLRDGGAGGDADR